MAQRRWKRTDRPEIEGEKWHIQVLKESLRLLVDAIKTTPDAHHLELYRIIARHLQAASVELKEYALVEKEKGVTTHGS